MKNRTALYALLAAILFALFASTMGWLEVFRGEFAPTEEPDSSKSESAIEPLVLEAIRDSESVSNGDSWIVPGGSAFYFFDFINSPEGMYESITYSIGPNELVALRASQIAGEGALYKEIFTVADDEKYVAIVAIKSNGAQMVYVLDPFGFVFDSFELSMADYGTITELGSLTVADETINAQGHIRTVAKVLCVTETGHWYRHWPSDGSPSPAFDDLSH